MLSIWRSNIYSFNKYMFPSQSWPKWNLAAPGNASTPLFSHLLLPLTWIYINSHFQVISLPSSLKNSGFYEVIPSNSASACSSWCCHLRSLKLLHGRFTVFLSSPATVNNCNVHVPSHPTSSLFTNQNSSPMTLYVFHLILSVLKLWLHLLTSHYTTSQKMIPPSAFTYTSFQKFFGLTENFDLLTLQLFHCEDPLHGFTPPSPLPVYFSPTKYKLPEDQNLLFHSYL